MARLLQIYISQGDKIWQRSTSFGYQNRSGWTGFGSKSDLGDQIFHNYLPKLVSPKISLAELILGGTDFGAITVTNYYYSNYHSYDISIFRISCNSSALCSITLKFIIVNRSSQNDTLLQIMTTLLE